jgi:hypothetical protein
MLLCAIQNLRTRHRARGSRALALRYMAHKHRVDLANLVLVYLFELEG